MLLENFMKKVLFIFLIFGVLTMFLGAADRLEDALVPYDEHGFYGGSIILLFLIYIVKAISMILVYMGFSLVLFLLLGLMGVFKLPKIIEDFKLIIKLYYTMKLEEAVFKHFLHFVFFTPLTFLFLFFINNFFEPSRIYLFMLLVFLYSLFFGFYVFLYLLMSVYFKNWKKVFIALILGGGVFIFFLVSGYFVFEPIYNTFYGS